MELKDCDIVYVAKNSPANEELRYSLRSLQNIPHRKVFIVGGCPMFINKRTVKHIPVAQKLGNKWLNTSSLLKVIVNNQEISDNFILFNDDFFVWNEIDKLPYYHDRTLSSRIMDFAKISWYTTMNGYCSRLKGASRALKFNKKKVLNFELHLPIILNKSKLSQIFKEYPSIGAKRSLYCNHYEVESLQHKDVKIYDMDSVPEQDWDFVSTSDASFAMGKVGKVIKKRFRQTSKYERKK